MDDGDYSTTVSRLRAAGCVFAEEEAALLLAAASDRAGLERLLQRRVEGFPLEYLLGWAEFCGLRIAVTPGVFVPRRRTEFLVQQALELLPVVSKSVVVDLCCGAGAIAAAIAVARPAVELHAADLDVAAVRCARQNLESFGPDGQPGAAVHQGDLFAALPGDLRGRIDLLVVNAPYVPTEEIVLMPAEARLYEAHAALDGGQDGLETQRRIAAEIRGWLVPGGQFAMETSKRQAGATAGLFTAQGLSVQVRSSAELAATLVIGAVPAAVQNAAE